MENRPLMSAANGLAMGEVSAGSLYTFGASGLHGNPVAVDWQTVTLAFGIGWPVPPFETVPATTWRTKFPPWPKQATGKLRRQTIASLRNDRIATSIMDDRIRYTFAELFRCKLTVGQLQPSTTARA